jgi:hypothetical protein
VVGCLVVCWNGGSNPQWSLGMPALGSISGKEKLTSNCPISIRVILIVFLSRTSNLMTILYLSLLMYPPHVTAPNVKP